MIQAAMVTQNHKLLLKQSLALQRRPSAVWGAPSLRSEADFAIVYVGHVLASAASLTHDLRHVTSPLCLSPTNT